MPLIRKAKGIYGLYRGNTKKSVRSSEIVGYYINYRDENGKPIKERVDASTIAEAQLALKQRIVERDRHRVHADTKERDIVKGKATISMIAVKYFDTRANSLRDKQAFDKYLLAAVGDKREVKDVDVKMLQKNLSATGLGNKTVNNHTDLLRTILNFGVDNGYLYGDAYIMRRYKKLDVDNIVEKYLNPSEVRELFEKSLLPDKVLSGEAELVENYEPSYTKRRLQFFLKILYYTGQRPISILDLQAKDIQGNAIDIAPVKKQDRHRVPISEHLMDDLRAWTKKLNPNDYLFHSENSPSKPINRYTMIEQGKPLFNHCNQGLDFKDDRKHWVSFYTMRHSAATNILAATGSEKYAGVLLNHSDPKMTKRYAKVLEDKMQGAVDGL